MTEYPTDWEEIDNSTYRMKVHSGWVVESIMRDPLSKSTSSICFVPDVNHEWGLEKE